MKIITNPYEIDLNKLEAFVCNHPNANFFQSTKAYKFFQAAVNYEPILLIVEEDKEIVGSLLAVIIKEGSGLKGYLSSRTIVWGGPLVAENKIETANELLKQFINLVSKNSIYAQIRNLNEMSEFKFTFNKLNWNYEGHLDILIDLTKSEEELWKDVNSKRRNEIRRAEREGTSFDVLSSKEQFKETYNILKEVYERVRLPLPDYTFFESAFDILFPENLKIFIALNEDRIIGTMYTLCYRGVIYDWYAGSFQEYHKKYPNDLIPWKVFLWGKENGYKIFDFGGAGKPDVPYGIRDYKKKYGGKLVNHGRFYIINKLLLYRFGKIVLKIYQKF